MPILRGSKIYILWIELSSYKRKPWELWIFSLETLTQVLCLKLEDKIHIENIIFINKYFNNLFPPIFKSWFNFCSDLHNYHTVSSTTDKIFKTSYRIDSYGKNSITLGAINSWNKTQHQFSDLSLKTFSPPKVKSLLFKKCIGKY